MVNHTRHTKKQNGGGGETDRIIELVKQKYDLNKLDNPKTVEISELVRLLDVYRKIKDGEMDNDPLFITNIISNIDEKKNLRSQKTKRGKTILTKVKEQMATEFEKIRTIIEKNTEYQQHIDKQEKAISRYNPVRRGAFKRKKEKLGVRPQYVLVFDYDHTLTNSYGNGNHSNGISYDDYNIDKTKPPYRRDTTKFIENYNDNDVESGSKDIYNATDKNRGDYATLRNQLCTLKENGVLMFVNSRGLKDQLVQRLKADRLLDFFGIDDIDINHNIISDVNNLPIAIGDIKTGIYGAFGTRESNTIGRRDWHKIKLQVIERILEQLETKKKIDEDNTELHFFDDEDANVDAFNTKFIENKNRVGHLIGQSSKRPTKKENSITQELNIFIEQTLQKTLQECPAHTALTAGGYRKTLHKSKKSRKSKKTKKSSRKTSKKH